MISKTYVTFFFAWYDMWIGAYWDQEWRNLYICPLPCCVIKISFPTLDERTVKSDDLPPPYPTRTYTQDELDEIIRMNK